MTTLLPLTLRQHFSLDPIFSECWNLMDKERQLILMKYENGEEKKSSQLTYENPSARIPYEWNDAGGNVELFSNFRLAGEDISSGLTNCSDSYKILLNVQHFLSEELMISLRDRTILIRGKHEERSETHGAVSRNFSRKYVLPSDISIELIQCNLSSDGVLHISAPRETNIRNSKKKNRNHVRFAKPVQSIELKSSDPNAVDTKIYEYEKLDLDDGIPTASHIALPDFDSVPFWDRVLAKKSPFGIKSDRYNFKVVVDTKNYDPCEVHIKVSPHHVKVEAKHEEKQDSHGLITRNFTRKYSLPSGIDPNDITSHFSSNGVLEIEAPRSHSQHEITEGEFQKTVRVPIQMKELPSPGMTKIGPFGTCK